MVNAPSGSAHFDNGNFDEAIMDFTEAIRLDPTLAEPYCNRGAAYYEKGHYDKAFADFTEAVRLKPTFAEAY